MCGIAGWINYKGDLNGEVEILEEMKESLSRRGPDAGGIFTDKHAGLVHRRLAVVDIEGGKQPMTRGNCTLIYNGELYNTEDIRAELLKKGYTFKGHSDTEVLLTAFIQWGEKCLEKLNGIYAFAVWNSKTKKLFAARDRMGVKPFFYKATDTGIVFASELKSLFKNPLCPALIDKDGINQIFLLAPGRIPGSGVYKGIEELKPGEYLCVNRRGIKKHRYFSFRAKPHTETLGQTIEHLRNLVLDSINRQLVSDVPLACFLSGGLDSSIITYVASKKYATENQTLTTYSVNFKDNDKFFEKNAFQPDMDDKFIKCMSDFCKTSHKNVVLENRNMFDALSPAALARDLAGMADIDSSLLLFCREVKKTHTVCLSGECADELFGGYPWFFDENALTEASFPWARSLDMRKGLLKKDLLVSNPEEFVHRLYKQTLDETDTLKGESDRDKDMRRLFMLNTQWFMQTLLDRKDRMSMYCGLEVRVPFCDHRLAEYAFNIPWDLKALGGREKGLMREAFKGLLPDEIVNRKKSPYPKSFDPEYFALVKEGAIAAVNRGGLLSKIIDKEYFESLINGNNQNPKPWYGQLMRLPQVFAMLMQIDVIFEEYKVKLI